MRYGNRRFDGKLTTFNWKSYYNSVSVDFDKVEEKCMALTIKEIEDITRKAMGVKDPDDLPTLIPTMMNDPDFGPSIIDHGSLNTGHQAGICDTMGCHFVPVKNYRFCKPCLKDRDFMDKWGKNSPDHRKHINAEWKDAATGEVVRQGVDTGEVQSLAEGTILMMETTNDDWNAALDIIYKEDD